MYWIHTYERLYSIRTYKLIAEAVKNFIIKRRYTRHPTKKKQNLIIKRQFTRHPEKKNLIIKKRHTRHPTQK